MGDPCGGIARNQILDIVDFPDRHNCEDPEVGSDDQRLILVIADDADSAFPAEMGKIIVKFGTELGIGDVVDGAHDRAVRTEHGKTSALGPEMRVVIGSVKQIRYAVFLCNRSKKSSHSSLSIPG